MINKTDEIKEIARRLSDLFPGAGSAQCTVIRNEGVGNDIKIDLFNVGGYDAGTTLLREFGVGEREKQPHNDELGIWHALKGESNGVSFTVFCDGLPHSCRIVKYTEKIPKQATVDTGEFIEVERSRVMCDGKEA